MKKMGQKKTEINDKKKNSTLGGTHRNLRASGGNSRREISNI